MCSVPGGDNKYQNKPAATSKHTKTQTCTHSGWGWVYINILQGWENRSLFFSLSLSFLVQKYWSQSSPGSHIQLPPRPSSHSYSYSWYHQRVLHEQNLLKNRSSNWYRRYNTRALPSHSAFFRQAKTINTQECWTRANEWSYCASPVTKSDIFRLLCQFFGKWEDRTKWKERGWTWRGRIGYC